MGNIIIPEIMTHVSINNAQELDIYMKGNIIISEIMIHVSINNTQEVDAWMNGQYHHSRNHDSYSY